MTQSVELSETLQEKSEKFYDLFVSQYGTERALEILRDVLNSGKEIASKLRRLELEAVYKAAERQMRSLNYPGDSRNAIQCFHYRSVETCDVVIRFSLITRIWHDSGLSRINAQAEMRKALRDRLEPSDF